MTRQTLDICGRSAKFSCSTDGMKRDGRVAQLVRVPDCRSGGCGFESRRARLRTPFLGSEAGFFVFWLAWRSVSGALVKPASPAGTFLAGTANIEGDREWDSSTHCW